MTDAIRRWPVVLHIPHAGYAIPDEYRSDYLLDQAALDHEIGLMTDHGTDFLFFDATAPLYRQVSPWSRLFVDMERFREDAQEPMSQLGMGVLYEKSSSGAALRAPLSADRRERILKDYYDAHHAALTAKVDEVLEAFGYCLIIDCHSFPKEPLPYENPSLARPAIGLGSDDFHTRPEVLEAFAQAFRAGGQEVAINEPFSGSLVPMKHYRKDPRVQSIMIEIRRDLYLTHQNYPEIRYGTDALLRTHELVASALDGALAALELAEF